MLRVHSIETLGTYDGPGIRLVVFMQGCNFKCLYCANPDTIVFGTGKITPAEYILKMARSQRNFFGTKGGVTISGGEPLMQAKALVHLFKILKADGFNTCLDTNGSILNSHVKELLKYTDLVLLDIKHVDNHAHQKLTGKPNTRVFSFANYLEANSIPFWLRYVLVPGHTDSEADMHRLGKLIATFKSVQKLEIQPYHMLGAHKYEALGWKYQLENVPSNSASQLSKAKSIFEQYIAEVVVN